ncbi:MAG TPA: ABC transporter permease subunit [Dehalococcoidales bacterium]
MKKLWIIARKDIKESYRSRSTYVYIAIMLVLTLSYFSSYNAVINSLNNQGANQQTIYDASRAFMISLAYALPMIYSILVCTIFAQYSVVVDKAKRNIESLMVTPTSLRQIWMGKTLAVTVPSVVIGISVAIIGYVVLNIIAVEPKAGSFIVPSVFAIVTALIIVPALIFTIVSIVIYIQLVISNPRIANLVFTGIFLLLFFGTTTLSAAGIDINFGLIYLGIIVLCAAISYFLSRSLTKERVILSSKG